MAITGMVEIKLADAEEVLPVLTAAIDVYQDVKAVGHVTKEHESFQRLEAALKQFKEAWDQAGQP